MESYFYQIFEAEVEAPYVYQRTLSNGVKVGKYYGTKIDGAMTNEEIVEYIRLNHIEEAKI